jgi:hypothetical protein
MITWSAHGRQHVGSRRASMRGWWRTYGGQPRQPRPLPSSPPNEFVVTGLGHTASTCSTAREPGGAREARQQRTQAGMPRRQASPERKGRGAPRRHSASGAAPRRASATAPDHPRSCP